MTLEIGFVYAVLLGAIVLFASDRLRLDVVAVLALLAVAIAGILTPGEALAGFADPVVVMIAALFVVGEGIFRTGIAGRIAALAFRFGAGGEVRMLIAVMLLVALLSGFMSSTGTVAVMLPVVMGLAARSGISASRLLIPMAIAALLGGLLTLIGTAPNIVVANQLAAAGRAPFRFFDFTPIGLAVVASGTAFVALVGRHLLPDRRPADQPEESTTTVRELAGEYRLPEHLHRLRISAGSPAAGARVDELRLRDRYGITVVDIRRRAGRDPGLRQRSRPAAGPELPLPVLPDTRLMAGDTVILAGDLPDVRRFADESGTALLSPVTAGTLPRHMGLVEVILTPRSRLLGHTLADLAFRSRYRVTVLGLRRLGELHPGEIRAVPLRFGDTLLVKGPWRNIELLQREHRDFLVADTPRELLEAGRPVRRAPLAATIVLGMLVLMTAGWLAPVLAVVLAAVAMVLTGCVRGEDAYRAISWESVVLIAAFLPLATALEKTGGLALLVDALGGLLGGGTPLLVLGALFILTSALSQVISNTATAVLLAPIALRVALETGYQPEPFLMGVAVAASTAFATPIASPVNILILGPGGYRFGDFFRLGLALQILLLLVSLAVIPRVFPF
jgi:di/tricarboxylate transporter